MCKTQHWVGQSIGVNDQTCNAFSSSRTSTTTFQGRRIFPCAHSTYITSCVIPPKINNVHVSCLLCCNGCRLEQHLLHWLVSLDIFAAGDIPDFSSITAELSSGVLLAEVAAAVGAAPVVGVQERPVSAASRASNIYAALEAVQQVPGSHSK